MSFPARDNNREHTEKSGSLKGRQVELFVLVAADKVKDHQLIKKALKKLAVNHLVSSVFNNEQLLNILQNKEYYTRAIPVVPQLLFLDVRLPVLNGIGALREIREQADVAEMLVCMIGDPGNEAKKEAENLGATGFLPRPLEEDRVLRVATSVLKPH